MIQKRLSATVTAGDQIGPSDLQDVAASGFRSIICNRPDGEGRDQPTFSEISAEARALNIDARYLPIATRQISEEDAVAFSDLCDQLPKPIYVYCRTGARSTALWQTSQRLFPLSRHSSDSASSRISL